MAKTRKRIGPSLAEDEADIVLDINTTPLIDIMLVLLIMLIITIPLQTHAVNLDMPVGTPPPIETPPPVVEIEIDFDGLVTWNGEVVNGRAELEARLRAAATSTPEPEIHLKPNKLVTYRYVAQVLAAAQRMGATKIGLVNNEQFVE